MGFFHILFSDKLLFLSHIHLNISNFVSLVKISYILVSFTLLAFRYMTVFFYMLEIALKASFTNLTVLYCGLYSRKNFLFLFWLFSLFKQTICLLDSLFKILFLKNWVLYEIFLNINVLCTFSRGRMNAGLK